ncbi:hypothetical protein Q3G72_011743 [Acer saccharum]|nr:hypothetical protein Q3G72_011743 [Acer saccharum]
MGELRKLRDSFTKPDPTYERLLKLQKEKQILSEYPHLREPLQFALAYLDPSLRAQIELELSRSSSFLDGDDDISLVLEIQELISLLTRVLVDLLNSSSSQSTPCA